MIISLSVQKGSAHPLGAVRQGDVVNFAVIAKPDSKIKLLLQGSHQAPLQEILLDPAHHLTGSVWHVAIQGLPEEFLYGYSVYVELVPAWKQITDPYAISIDTSINWGEENIKKGVPPLARFFNKKPFDWENVQRPHIDWKDLIIYEMHVRGFTQHHTSKVKWPGSYLGLIEKIPYLKELGINAIELLPIYLFNECELTAHNPETKERLYNYWGYSPWNCLCPMRKYAVGKNYGDEIQEFKTLVRECHKAGIEVILDVVFNHTGEGNDQGPFFGWKAFTYDYYILSHGHFTNYSGCGNTLSANHPITRDWILYCLKYWVEEFQIDGFRFDLASILTRDPNGVPLENPPIIDAIAKDPVLSDVKMIAEAWDAAGLYQVGYFPGNNRFAEWNGAYRDDVRRFFKGSGSIADFSRAITGSQYLFGRKKPHCSVNFVCAHDGFSLVDLVSYDTKKNLPNGEFNRDGCDQNDSWNCGYEGYTTQAKVQQLRTRQMKNFALTLLISIGTPMISMGDEYVHTRFGNNNPYCQDNDTNWFLWDERLQSKEIFAFFKQVIAFRKSQPLLRRETFFTDNEIDWHGVLPFKAAWDSDSRMIACTIKDLENHHHIYIAFSSYFVPIDITLPNPPQGMFWYRVCDTSLTPPLDFCSNKKMYMKMDAGYQMSERSCIVCIARSENFPMN